MDLLTVTEKAAGRIRELLEKQGTPEGGLRVKITSGGCAGFQYRMDLVEAAGEKDFVVEAHGARVVLDARSAIYLAGSEIDFVSGGLMGARFEVRNPNAAASCSCGDSFDLKRQPAG
ncbi:MAG: iron-sulfur cluster assembly accessory protein [Armatimonadetes bacterium]|nr:iron-sulfur cluster assembly accessory protein [Armatimonadota bacterium]